MTAKDRELLDGLIRIEEAVLNSISSLTNYESYERQYDRVNSMRELAEKEGS